MAGNQGGIDSRVIGWPVALLRVCLGVLFLRSAWAKLEAGSEWPNRMLGFLHSVQAGTSPEYRQFLETCVLPNATLFAWSVLAGELYVGTALVLGLSTRLASLVGLLMVTNFILAKGATFWLPTNNDALFVFILLTLMCCGAGRVLGVDRALARRWPRVPFW